MSYSDYNQSYNFSEIRLGVDFEENGSISTVYFKLYMNELDFLHDTNSMKICQIITNETYLFKLKLDESSYRYGLVLQNPEIYHLDSVDFYLNYGSDVMSIQGGNLAEGVTIDHVYLLQNEFKAKCKGDSGNYREGRINIGEDTLFSQTTELDGISEGYKYLSECKVHFNTARPNIFHLVSKQNNPKLRFTNEYRTKVDNSLQTSQFQIFRSKVKQNSSGDNVLVIAYNYNYKFSADGLFTIPIDATNNTTSFNFKFIYVTDYSSFDSDYIPDTPSSHQTLLQTYDTSKNTVMHIINSYDNVEESNHTISSTGKLFMCLARFSTQGSIHTFTLINPPFTLT